MKFYTGIGSRSTPPEELAKLTKIATFLEECGYILRSGGAEGADQAFEAGISQPSMKEIYRPRHSDAYAEEIAAKIHPMWSACNVYARQLHGRNVMLVLGRDLKTPSDFVVAWTYDGIKSGGTRTGLVLAKQRGIPAFNLADRDDVIKFGAFLVSIRPKQSSSGQADERPRD